MATSLLGLSGCVAAAAIPMLAGGSMLGSDAVAGKDERAAPAPTSVAAPPTGAARDPDTADDSRFVVLDRTTLPTPSENDVRSGVIRRIEARSFDAFYGYALAQASLDPLEAPMRSAFLENPGALEPIRQVCGTREPVVVVDLDPQGALFDPEGAGSGNAALGEVLAVLRSRGIAIAWASGLPASAEPAIRTRLAREALDPKGSDLLLLLDDGHANKQARRTSLASTHCAIAIAGDAREDFDELFAYLKNPDAATALDEMFGAGWFLTPNPID